MIAGAESQCGQRWQLGGVYMRFVHACAVLRGVSVSVPHLLAAGSKASRARWSLTAYNLQATRCNILVL